MLGESAPDGPREFFEFVEVSLLRFRRIRAAAIDGELNSGGMLRNRAKDLLPRDGRILQTSGCRTKRCSQVRWNQRYPCIEVGVDELFPSNSLFPRVDDRSW